MEFLTKKNELTDFLGKLSGVAEKRHTLPVLSHCLIEAGDGKIRGTATDLDIIVRCSCPADVTVPGSYLIPTKKFLDVVKVLPTDTVKVSLLENGYVQVLSGKSRFKIAGLPPKEFPDLPEKEEGESFSVNGFDLKVMFERVFSFASSEESRSDIAGVFLENTGDDTLRLVATDGHRLAYVEQKVPSLPKRLENGVIVPRKGVTELSRLLDELSGEVTVTVSESFIAGGTEEYEVTARLVGGEFPAYREVIPSSPSRKVSMDRERFADALRRVSVISTDRLKSVILEVNPQETQIQSMSQDVGEAVDYVDSTLEGEEFRIGFNSRYLLDVTNSCGGESVVMEVTDELSPVLFRSGERDDFLAVVMPIRTTA
ncbi:MAG: DNA polymerase III subunit beta [Deltaproteobacteria bacterium]|nr:MAG: DNA polymerase III subunit beta [Deltaproteobacteria bacterium]